MRAITFNIHHGVGADGRLDLERIESLIEDLRPDVAGLQEVDRRYSWRSGFVDQARVLSQRLGMRLAYGAALDLEPAEPGQPRRRFGNAVLSRFPIVARKNVVLPRTTAVELRALLRATIDLGDRRVEVYVTHLEARDLAQRALQAAAVTTTIAGHNGPCLLLADLNAEPDRPEMAALAAVLRDAWQVGSGRGRTYPSHDPQRRIDVVLHSAHLRPSAASVVVSPASDHRPVVADLD
jgi:endonuclease/exonuclease/phosphatase family metal-dependent hydrolase